jgi:hypothetical protein
VADWSINDTRSPERISYRIWLTSSQPNYGGQRYWFCYPGTGKRAAKLFLPRGGHQFLSREAYRLGYACQRETRSDRLIRKARRLHRGPGGKGDPLEGVHRRSPRGCIGEPMSGSSPPGRRRWKRQTKLSERGLDDGWGCYERKDEGHRLRSPPARTPYHSYRRSVDLSGASEAEGASAQNDVLKHVFASSAYPRENPRFQSIQQHLLLQSLSLPRASWLPQCLCSIRRQTVAGAQIEGPGEEETALFDWHEGRRGV